MKVENRKNCSFSSWYHKFKNVTIRSRIVPLPEAFTEYLLADGLVLPEDCCNLHYDANSDDEESTVDWQSSDEETITAKAPSFPEFNKVIKNLIKELGGKVFPKLNWSSPRDAIWISANNTAVCSTVSDVYLLLKSSDFITNDLTTPFKFCEDQDDAESAENRQHELVLRRWVDIDPASEFRCFVYNEKIIGICQRDCTTFYKYIDQEKKGITDRIQNFFIEKISGKFLDPDYVFDIYIKNEDCIRLIDFNPFGEITDSLLFDWAELKQATYTIVENNQDPLFRCVTCDSGVQPNPYRHYSLPRDIVDLTSGEDPLKLMDLLKLKTQFEGSQSSDEDT